MGIKFIHTADLHLGCRFEKASFPRKIAKKRRLEMWDTFEDILTKCREYKVDFLLISGDLFEGSLITIGEIKRISNALKDISPTIVIINPGNHDPYNDKSPYKKINWPENVHMFKEKMESLVFQQLSTVIYGYPWSENYIEDKFYLTEMYAEYDNKILMLHGDAFSNNSKYLAIDVDSLQASNFDYIALGHIHKRGQFTEKIQYSGSPEPLDFGEPGTHGVILGELSNGCLKTQFIPMSKREFRIVEFEINPNMSYQEIKERILSFPQKEKDLYRFELKGIVDSDIDLEDLIEDIRLNFFHVEFIKNVILDYDLEKLSQENKGNIIGLFIEEMKKRDLSDEVVRDALYIGLQALLEERER